MYNKSKISKHFCAILRCNQRCEITLSSFQTKTCNEPINCSMTFFTRDNQVSRVRIRRIVVHHFVFSLKTADLATLFLSSGVHDRPQRRKGFGSFFYRKFINCLLKHCEIWRKANLRTKSLWKALAWRSNGCS